ncbi:hypothetical protein I2494_03960 [Budviciaceae bacterium BWR-B9]|uniref:Host cell division inhibitor Icd-like protein n=1 Tax=Limnobaculum allomyrinae TaxID=2791986 RepID=A0ABS1IMB0_9GAMM|nr:MULTISPECIES: hypothetical protein [Limnobaculum]MBK5142878.1 hypothetical protein [Limnobaculum allomyrinae]MBV7690235.1 hypothetical protein [Limnobaculum sp. M2-1]
MADIQHTQTHPKFTFLIGSGRQRLSDLLPLQIISVTAANEQEARSLAGFPSLVFVSRQEVRHA